MKLSLNWLKDFVNIPKEITPEKLAEELTLKTVEVEGIEKQGENLKGVVVGELLDIKKHPDADKLKVCIVDVGEDKSKQIICGGINLEKNMYVAVAKIGAKVKWHGEGELVEIKKTKIRGVESEGMICASSEIGVENLLPCGDKEIIDLFALRHPERAITNEGSRNFSRQTIGEKLTNILGLDDVILEIDNKSLTNRPDLWNHIGMAREIAAIFGVEMKKNIFSENNGILRRDLPAVETSQDDALVVDVQNQKLCPRYMAVAMSGIKIGPSPDWMQKRLLAVGMRPINNIVDITNYVMLEVGQPMHAFGKSKVKEADIIIRNAKENEEITTLDGEQRKLDEGALVIADSEKPIAIAGIMGGANSEIDENTTEIILESANFEKENNRKTSVKLGLRTEAVMRYEKGLDPTLAKTALTRCIELIKEIIPESQISSNDVDIANFNLKQTPIKISIEYINKKIGVEISKDKIVNILESLGFDVETQDLAFLQVSVPSWRATGDVDIADDIVEEIARIYGYNNIKPQMPNVKIEPSGENQELKFIKKIKNILGVGCGMAEVSNYSFISEKQVQDLGLELGKCIKLSNPLSEAQELLRPNLAINLLKNAKDNLRFFSDFKIFEIGNVFKNIEGDECADPSCKEKLSWQEKFIGGVIVGDKNSTPFYQAKEIVEGLLNNFGIDFTIIPDEKCESWKHPYRSAKFQISNFKFQNYNVGYLAEVSPIVAKNMGVKNARVAVFEISIKALPELLKGEKIYQKISPFPAVLRDVAVVADKQILAYNIISTIKKIGGQILKDISFFDYYEGDQIEANKKSLAFHLEFQAEDRTLGDKEVDEIVENVVKGLEKMRVKLRK